MNFKSYLNAFFVLFALLIAAAFGLEKLLKILNKKLFFNELFKRGKGFFLIIAGILGFVISVIGIFAGEKALLPILSWVGGMFISILVVLRGRMLILDEGGFTNIAVYKILLRQGERLNATQKREQSLLIDYK